MPMNLSEVQATIEAALPGSKVAVRDLVGDGDHLEAIVIADQFQGLSLLKQHQLVMEALKESLQERLHAIKLKTYSPEQWEKFGKSA